MSQVQSPTEPGWRPDPSGRFEWRYWDGGWTNRVANSAATPAGTPTPGPEPAPVAAAPIAPPPQAPHSVLPAPTATAVPEPEPGPVDATPTTASDPRPSRDTVARAPFGADTGDPPPSEPPVRRIRRSPWQVIVDFVRSFADQPESYHSDLAREPLPDDGRGGHILTAAPGNYGHAGLVAVAACGVVIGAYLPWLSGTIGISSFARSGFDQGLGAGYTIGAISLAVSALLSVRMRVFRWLTVVLSFVIAGFVVRDLLNSYDAMQTMNAARSVDANVGTGLWIMIVSAAIAMIASVRLSEDQKID
jgi:hypothetical protein